MSRRQAAVARALPVLPTTLLLLFLLLLHVGPSRVGVHALQGYITRFLGHHTPSGVAVDGAAREVGFVDIREVKYHGGYLWLLSGARDKAIGTLKAGTDRRDNVAVRRVSLDTGETVTYLGGYAVSSARLPAYYTPSAPLPASPARTHAPPTWRAQRKSVYLHPSSACDRLKPPYPNTPAPYSPFHAHTRCLLTQPCPDGTSGVAQRQGYLCAPKGMDFDSSGNMWLGSKNGLMKVVPGDASTFWAPTVKYHSTSSDITGYVDVVIGADDVVYIATESSIKKYDPAAGGAPATWVGSAATDPASRADGVLAAAKFYQLSRMTISADGATLYLLEYFDRIRKVDVSTGAVTTLSHFNCSSAISVRSFGSPAVLQCFEDLEADPNGNICELQRTPVLRLCSGAAGAPAERTGGSAACAAMCTLSSAYLLGRSVASREQFFE